MKPPFHVGKGELLVWRRMVDGLPAIVIDRREPPGLPGWQRESCSIEGDLVLTFATKKQAWRVWRAMCPKHKTRWFDRWRAWPDPENSPGVECWKVEYTAIVPNLPSSLPAAELEGSDR